MANPLFFPLHPAWTEEILSLMSKICRLQIPACCRESNLLQELCGRLGGTKSFFQMYKTLQNTRNTIRSFSASDGLCDTFDHGIFRVGFFQGEVEAPIPVPHPWQSNCWDSGKSNQELGSDLMITSHFPGIKFPKV